MLLSAVLAFAQEETEIKDVKVPNPMGVHTWFIIVAVGVFLAWCISYCLQMRKESARPRPKRAEFLHQKEQILNRLAELESQKETGAIGKEKYEREFKKARSRLSEVLERLKGTAGGSEEA
jgi:hypothetical protein